jgi:hypothetical protein
VHRKDPGAQLILDHLAVILVPTTKANFGGLGCDGGGARILEYNVLGVGA